MYFTQTHDRCILCPVKIDLLTCRIVGGWFALKKGA